MPGRIGKSGRVRSSAWTWLFSSIDSTMARSGGQRYSPTMSRTFSTNCGSADNLNVSRRCDCNPNVCQMRAIVAFESPATSARLARRPLRRVSRRAFERAGNHVDDPIVGRFARRAGPWLVRQPRQDAARETARAICRRCYSTRGSSLGHRAIRQARPRTPAPSATAAPALRRLRAARPLLQRAAFVLSQQHRLVVAFSRHGAQRTRAAAEVQDFFWDTTLGRS